MAVSLLAPPAPRRGVLSKPQAVLRRSHEARRRLGGQPQPTEEVPQLSRALPVRESRVPGVEGSRIVRAAAGAASPRAGAASPRAGTASPRAGAASPRAGVPPSVDVRLGAVQREQVYLSQDEEEAEAILPQCGPVGEGRPQPGRQAESLETDGEEAHQGVEAPEGHESRKGDGIAGAGRPQG